MRSPWWAGLDLRVLRHVRGVLRRRGLELTLVERRPDEVAAFAPLSIEQPAGPGLAVITPDLSPPERALVEIMLGEAASDVAAALHERDRKEPRVPEPPGQRTRYHGIVGGARVMLVLYDLLEGVAPADSTVLIQGENGTGKELVSRAI
ncbi:MAG: sigma 54-interacting transcriptional regulator, partial [Kofleriaceae bacterium]